MEKKDRTFAITFVETETEDGFDLDVHTNTEGFSRLEVIGLIESFKVQVLAGEDTFEKQNNEEN